jgi:hypothetical protein
LRCRKPIELRDDVERAVDPRSQAAGRHDLAVVYNALIAYDFHLRISIVKYCQVLGGGLAGNPSSSPASARINAPLQTEMVCRLVWLVFRIQAFVAESARILGV